MLELSRPPNCVPLTPGMSPNRWLPDKVRRRDGIRPDIEKALQAIIAGNRPWPLVMVGEAGSGKTCAALVVIDTYGGLYYPVVHWCERVRDAEFGNLRTSNGYQITRYEVWKEWTEANIVVLDEIGSRMTVTDAHYEHVKRAIDTREGRPAIFISNLSLADLSTAYDDRIASRLSGGTVIELKGDRRGETPPGFLEE